MKSAGKVVSEIGFGLNVLLGICEEDTEDDVKFLADKILNLRIFEEDEKMNKSLLDVGGTSCSFSIYTVWRLQKR